MPAHHRRHAPATAALARAVALALTAALAVAAGAAHAAPGEPRDAGDGPGATFADGYAAAALAAIPPCPAEATRCFGLRLHVATAPDGAPVVPAAWLAEQVAHADLCFAAVGVGFAVVAVADAGSEVRRVLTRDERDHIGREGYDPRLIDVWLVEELANVDAPGPIRGVHWRDRAHRAHRWILVSSIAPPHVLAHELGHYFGLPHSAYAGSLMNKTGNDDTPSPDRRFVTAEQRIIAASARRFAKARGPVDRRLPGPKKH